MAEQLTQVTGRLKQQNNAPFFLVNVEDIDASIINNANSVYPDTSLRHFLAGLQARMNELQINFEDALTVQPIPEAEIIALFNEYKEES